MTMYQFKVIARREIRHNRRLYVTGDIIDSPSKLDEAFPTKFELIGEPAPQAPPPSSSASHRRRREPDAGNEKGNEPPNPASALVVTPKGSGWFDVINASTGEAVNTKALRKDEAEKLVEDEFGDDAQA